MPTYYNDPYSSAPRWLIYLLVFLLSTVTSSAVLTDCYGGYTETVRAQVRGRQYAPGGYAPKGGHIPASWQLYMRTPEGYEWVECAPEVYYRVPDFDTLTIHRQRTRWTNYTFSSHF